MINKRMTGYTWIKLACIIFALFGGLYLSSHISKAAEDDREFNAVWISYLEFNDRLKDPSTGELGFSEKRFQNIIDEMFDNVVELKMDAVIVHVRPFGDAFYPSDYFPWSKYISGTQGKDPGFDPLKYMVSAAHKRDLEFHAWLNPYRVTSNSTDYKALAKDNMARRWRTDKLKTNDRRVISYNGSLYYNPSDIWVQSLIRNGIEEIVTNYDVDGIHFDDYFYPTLGSNYKKSFDHIEYNEYVKWCKENGVKIKPIEQWRRDNVNRLVKKSYQLIKGIDKSVEFGISPGGFLDYLLMDDRYYTDIKTWMSKPGYIDYIAPQIYWSFNHSRFPYDETLDRWLELRKNQNVKVYVGIATYRAGSDLETDWKKDPYLLKKQIEYGRNTGKVDGYMHFRYDFFYKKATQTGVKHMLKIIN
ncbi:family 10 glycosylhydrolase [Mobilitalea sibirica]|uniref:Family 10 glycosylhydrolase n=1 Tax=Mobilitalea sibirica TaxID=1462919 RepID=A0A8J7KT38_9FIRM|nr:family 10 glycosylhydrolase [Mobilitalea sibirica]MBH1940956.1 family 10 glycosylhydrolase [Mobilitalea sibirica]